MVFQCCKVSKPDPLHGRTCMHDAQHVYIASCYASIYIYMHVYRYEILPTIYMICIKTQNEGEKQLEICKLDMLAWTEGSSHKLDRSAYVDGFDRATIGIELFDLRSACAGSVRCMTA